MRNFSDFSDFLCLRGICCVLPVHGVNAYKLCFTYRKRKSKIIRQKNIDRHDLRPLLNVCYHPDPLWFSLQTTFNDLQLMLSMRFTF
jgi:hypothetical protein